MNPKLLTAIWDYSTEKGYHRLLLLAFADQADDRGCSLWMGREHLARRTAMSPRQITRTISDLAERDAIAVIPRSGTTNLYVLKYPATYPHDPIPFK